jgi:anti-sigma B factor antagonist
MLAADGARPADRLEASVAAGDAGPVVVLSGEADYTSLARLDAVLSGQLSGGTRWLTIDVSGLSFADTASIRALLLTAKALKERCGSLVLLNPQRPVARVLALLGADQMVTIQTRPDPVAGPDQRS